MRAEVENENGRAYGTPGTAWRRCVKGNLLIHEFFWLVSKLVFFMFKGRIA